MTKKMSEMTEKLKKFQGSDVDQSGTPKSESLYLGKPALPGGFLYQWPLLEPGLEQLCPRCVLPSTCGQRRPGLGGHSAARQREQQSPCAP